MNTTIAEKKLYYDLEKDNKSPLQNSIYSSVNNLQKTLKSYALFNLFFCFLISLELIYLLFHLTFLVQTFVIAIHLALVFVTIFSYFTLRLYFQTKKGERFFSIIDDFISSVKKQSTGTLNAQNEHLIVASACYNLASELYGKEFKIYTLPDWSSSLSSSIEKLSCWLTWKDVYLIKELLLHTAVKEHIKLVKLNPTNLEAHVGLANAYVMLSGLYVDPQTIEGLDEDQWIPPNKYNEAFKDKFVITAQKAVEEFKIIREFAPHDPWVHAQLAFSYHDLQMPKEEIKEYETILELCPDDKDTLFKLGKLYFEQGLNGKGLQVYENLKKSNYKRAESLIEFYGSYELV